MRRNRENNSSTFIDTIKKYIDFKVEYYQLLLAEKVGILVGKVGFIIFATFLALVLFILILVLIYNLLLTWIGIQWVVSLILIGFVALLIGILVVFKNKLVIDPIASAIIRVILDPDDKDEEDDWDE